MIQQQSDNNKDDDDEEIPQYISVTFFRNNPFEDIPIKLEELVSQYNNKTIIRVTAVYLTYLPIKIGDLLVSISLNDEEWNNHNRKKNNNNDDNNNTNVLSLDILERCNEGILTLRFEKATTAAKTNALRESFFVQPQAHTCLPMAIDVQQNKNGKLIISRLDETNEWISNSYLDICSNVISINGTKSHRLDEENAQKLLMSKLTEDPYLSIQTSLPPEKEEEIMMSSEFLSKEKIFFKDFLDKNKGNQELDRVGDYNTYYTSKQLFLAIQKSLLRVENERVYSLPLFTRDVLSKALEDYSLTTLEKQLPRPPAVVVRNVLSLRGSNNNNNTNKNQQQQPQSYHYRLTTEEDITRTCRIIATCEYCANQSQALQDLLQEQDSKKKKEKSTIFLTDVIEKFHELISKGMTILISGIMNRLLDQGFPKMHSTFVQYYYWKIKDVEEESPYIPIMCQEIQSYINILATTTNEDNTSSSSDATSCLLLPPYYFRSFCDKFVVAFCTTYYNTCHRIIVTQRKNNADISQNAPGIQQLLLDIYHLKKFCFLNLDKLPKDNYFVQLAESQCCKIEKLLKTEWNAAV